MAPRGVLAIQHYDELKKYADTLGINIAFLRSGMNARERREVLNGISSGEIPFIVGTHSCLSDDVIYKNLGTIITDEEHLFGVKQKEQLEKKAGEGVHMLSMSATPIPRTLATIIFGKSKEILTIKTMPKGRLPIKTISETGHSKSFAMLEHEIKNGHQAYVVCPAIENKEDTDIVSIEEMEIIYRNYFVKRRIEVGILNGKMKKDEIEAIIKDFVDGKIQILLSTTVVEVGVNVPNATVMVIEQADRFGLASLHQLRGRVGRNNYQSYCILVTDAIDNPRIRIMCETTDGFRIAEEDLKLRGTGNLIGVEQAGFNKYVEEMIMYPDLYKKACDYAFRYKNELAPLIDEYKQHEECDAARKENK